MHIAVMQPYFFPYIGYYQMASSVDNFVFLDDANMIKKGFINKNRILLNNEIYNFSIPLIKCSQNRKINEHLLAESPDGFLEKIFHAYRKSLNFKSGISIIEQCFADSQQQISKLCIASISSVFSYIEEDFHYSISSSAPSEKKSQDRIIEICKKQSAKTYWNLPGGKSLYSEKDFEKEKIDLKFFDPVITPYSQTPKNKEFISHLSIIDVIMNNNKDQIIKMIKQTHQGKNK